MSEGATEAGRGGVCLNENLKQEQVTKKGCYGNLDEALGKSFDSLVSSELTTPIDPQTMSIPALKNLAEYCGSGKAYMLSTEEWEDRQLRFLTDIKLEGGRRAVFLLRLEAHATDADREAASYRAEK